MRKQAFEYLLLRCNLYPGRDNQQEEAGTSPSQPGAVRIEEEQSEQPGK